jgi:hypothetical protein
MYGVILPLSTSFCNHGAYRGTAVWQVARLTLKIFANMRELQQTVRGTERDSPGMTF